MTTPDDLVNGLLPELERQTRRPVDRERLCEALSLSMHIYDGAISRAPGDAVPDTLPELAARIDGLTPHLLETTNVVRVARDPDDVERLHTLADELMAIRERAITAHRKPIRGQPREKELYDVVRVLADYWADDLELPFTAKWDTVKDRQGRQTREPTSPAAVFIVSVMGIIDATRIKELPTVAKNVVAERRRGPGAKQVSKTRR